ncbi:MAG: tetratricopeptide repeat protein [Deltaproteobacteria bacterium]|nr:tetratricopeptide repeat protein [Deltaproteobacteria bacterium]
MGRKKKDKSEDLDAVADFFGEDIDWLEDDDSVDTGSLPLLRTGEELPVAPAPSATPPPAPTAAPPSPPSTANAAEPVETEPVEPVAADPATTEAITDVEGTPVVPGEAPPVAPAVVSYEATEELRIDGAADSGLLEEFEPPTLEVDPTSEESLPDFESSAPAAPEPPAPEVDEEEARVDWEELEEIEEYEVIGDDLEATGQTPAPLVHTHDPPPERPHPTGEVAPTFGPPAEPEPPQRTVPRYVPGDERSEWRAVATSLIAEASIAPPQQRGGLLFWAARLYRRRIGDEQGALALLADAISAGFNETIVHRERASAALSLERWRDAGEAFAAQADTLKGIARSEAFQDAAGMAAQRGDWAAAVDHLEQAIQADDTDYIAMSLLRDQLAGMGDAAGRIPVLDQMASLSPDPLTAEALWEKGVLLSEHGDVDGAREALEGALDKWPGHAPAFLSLRAIFLDTADHPRRAALYEREANRPGQVDPGWWYLKAARAWRDANQEQRADAMYTAATALGEIQPRREQQAWLLSRDKVQACADAIREEITREKRNQAKSFGWYRLACILELQLEDPVGAVEAYQKAVELDSAAEPAREAVDRLRQRDAQGGELLANWEKQAEATDGESRIELLARVAELAELLDTPLRARSAWERLLELQPGYVSALSGLQRVMAVEGDREALARIYAQRAEFAETDEVKAQWLYLAATQPDTPGEEAREVLDHAGDIAPGDRIVLEARERLLRKIGAWEDLVSVLAAAGEAATEPSRAARLYYRAARIAQDRLHRPEDAARLVEKALEQDSDLVPARALDGDLTADRGASRKLFHRYRDRAGAAKSADVRAWWRIAAAQLGEGLEDADVLAELHEVLDQQPAHPGALAALEFHCLATGNRSELANAYLAASEAETSVRRRAERVAWLADLEQEAGEEGKAARALRELAGFHAPKAPMRAAARLAAAQHDWKEATALLKRSGAPEDLLERARILGHYQKNSEAAIEAYRAILDEPDVRAGAALGLVQVGRASGNQEAMRAGHRVLCEIGQEPFRAAHYAWAADICELRGENAEALAYHREVIALRPESRTTFDAIRRLLVAGQDVDGLRKLYATHRPEDARGLAEDLESADAWDAAAEQWKRAVEEADLPLPVLVELERALARLEDWKGLYGVLSRREALVADESVRDAIEGQRRWLLAEKLADTEEAWNLFRALRAEQPDDTVVTEALARIAGQRGETALAVEYLTDLANAAKDPADAARYKRRAGEALERAENHDDARQCYLDALDYVPEDTETLGGLKRIAEATKDWSSLVAVLQREAGLAERGERAGILREVAQITEEKLQDPLVALDAWRSVLDEDPRDREALERLVSLSETHGEWAVYAEAGSVLADLLTGEERGELLTRLGKVCEDNLDRDAVPFYERAIAETPPHPEAAERLQAIYERRNDWVGAVRLLRARANTTEPVEERAALLARAAHIEARIHRERGVAVELYREVLSLDPDHVDALSYVASWLYDQGQLEEAIPYHERLEPHATEGKDLDDFDVRMEVALEFFHFAQILDQAGRSAEALPRLERVLELNPTHLPSLELVAPLYTAFGQWEKAEKATRQVLQLTGGTGDKKRIASTYAKLGAIERELGNHEKAFKRFNKALELHPTDVSALKGMALIFEDRQDWDSCMRSYNNIIYHATERTHVIDAYMSKGRLLDDQLGRRDKAAEHYQRSLDVEPSQPKALLRLAELALRDENWAEAEAYAHRGLKFAMGTGPVRADLLLCWAVARKHRSDTEAAKSALSEAASAHPPLAEILGEDPWADVEAIQRGIRERLP